MQQWFKTMQWDRRLVITSQEYKEMMDRLEKQHQVDESIFEVPVSVCYQKNKSGLIPHHLAPLSSTFEAEDLYGTGNLSQEVGIPSDSDEGSNIDGEDSEGILPMLSGNPFNDMVATLEVLTGQLTGNHRLMSKFTHQFFSLVSNIHGQCRTESSSRASNMEGEFVSLLPETDKRRKAKRIKSAYEPTKKKAKNGRRRGLTAGNSLM